MEKITQAALIAVFVLTSCNLLFARDRYKLAYHYICSRDTTKQALGIARDEIPDATVYDSTVQIGVSLFASSILNDRKIQTTEITARKYFWDSLSEVDKNIWSKFPKRGGLAYISKNKHARFVIFFSQTFKNQLLAELYPIASAQDLNEQLRRENSCIQYLFFFDKFDKIKRVYANFVQP